MYCLQVTDDDIKHIQFPYMTYYLADQAKLLDLLKLKPGRTEDKIKGCILNSYGRENTYGTIINSYEEIVFENPINPLSFDEKNLHTKQALEILTKATFFMEDAYHTQGSVLHVTCPEEYKTQCFNQIAPNHFLCSVYENLGYAYHYYINNQKTKSIKYIERFTEALMIYIIRISGRELLQPQVYDSLLYCPPPSQSNRGKNICQFIAPYNEIYKLYDTAKKLNCKRKTNQEITQEDLAALPDNICNHAQKWLTQILSPDK